MIEKKDSLKKMFEDFEVEFYEGLNKKKLNSLFDEKIYDILSISKGEILLLVQFTSKTNPSIVIDLRVNAIGDYLLNYSKEAREYYGEGVFLGFGTTPHARLVNIVNFDKQNSDTEVTVMKKRIELGTKIEDWFNGEKVGEYIVSLIPSFDGVEKERFALVNLNGKGLGNGYFKSLEVLEDVILNDTAWRVIE